MIFFILVFIGLGTWQLQRKGEKEALLERLAQSKSAPAQNVDTLLTPSLFQHVFAEGHFLQGKTIFLQSKVHMGKNGVYVFDVFQSRRGHYLLVQRGWAQKEIYSFLKEDLKVKGIARQPSPPSYFQPANTKGTYFWIDLKALSQDLEIPLLPYYLVAKDSFDPRIQATNPISTLSNNHLEYAITWYSLAFSLIFMLFWRNKTIFKRKSCDCTTDNA